VRAVGNDLVTARLVLAGAALEAVGDGLVCETLLVGPLAGSPRLGQGSAFSCAIHGCPTWDGALSAVVVRNVLELEDCQTLTHLPPLAAGIQKVRVRDCPALAALPEGLDIRSALVVENCSALRSLPADLRLGGDEPVPARNNPEAERFQKMIHDMVQSGTSQDEVKAAYVRNLARDFARNAILLAVRGCPAWDEVVPEGVRGHVRVVTDACPEGVSAERWRQGLRTPEPPPQVALGSEDPVQDPFWKATGKALVSLFGSKSLLDRIIEDAEKGDES
jgi:hypothetical protein